AVEPWFEVTLDPAHETDAVIRVLRAAGDGALIEYYAEVGRNADARVLGARYASDTAPPVLPGHVDRAFAGIWQGAFLGLAQMFAATGKPEAARDFFKRASMMDRLLGNDWSFVGDIMHDLFLGVLPYQADHLTERESLARLGEEAAA